MVFLLCLLLSAAEPPGMGHSCQQQAHLSPLSDTSCRILTAGRRFAVHPWAAHSKGSSSQLEVCLSLALPYPNTLLSLGCFQFACFMGLFSLMDSSLSYGLLSVLVSLLKPHGSHFSRTVNPAMHNTHSLFWFLSAILSSALFIWPTRPFWGML